MSLPPMNRRSRASAKKIEFEPKIPQEDKETPAMPHAEVIVEQHTEEESGQQQIKGSLAPKAFSKPREFNIETDSFMLNLPASFQECSLVVFTDNTLGIRMDGVIYQCDASFIGDGMVVEIGDSVKKIGSCDFLLTAYHAEVE